MEWLTANWGPHESAAANRGAVRASVSQTMKTSAVYGAFCVIVALLTWIYLSGCIFIFGACLCAAQAEGRSLHAETITAH